MIHRPRAIGAFEFVVMATQRAAQLMRGCRPKLEGQYKATVMAQFEVADGKVARMWSEPAPALALSEPNRRPALAVPNPDA